MINLYEFDKESAKKSEITDVIFEDSKIRIERIVSMGQTTPRDYVYDQNEDEFVTVIKGEAIITLVDENRDFHLYEGDTFMLYAGVRHRVSYTSSPCIWLCVFSKVIKDE